MRKYDPNEETRVKKKEKQEYKSGEKQEYKSGEEVHKPAANIADKLQVRRLKDHIGLLEKLNGSTFRTLIRFDPDFMGLCRDM